MGAFQLNQISPPIFEEEKIKEKKKKVSLTGMDNRRIGKRRLLFTHQIFIIVYIIILMEKVF
jgi:hypothetical protein